MEDAPESRGTFLAGDVDGDGASVAEGARLFEEDTDLEDAGLLEAGIGDGLGEALEEEEGGTFDEVGDAMLDGDVVDGVFETVGEARDAKVGEQSEGDVDVLRLATLPGADADDAAEAEVADVNAIEMGVTHRCVLSDGSRHRRRGQYR
jgi:hypothetical protein